MFVEGSAVMRAKLTAKATIKSFDYACRVWWCEKESKSKIEVLRV